MAAAGIVVVSGETNVHLVLIDLRNSQLDGRDAEDRLHAVGITVNRNAVPFDQRPAMISSGVRIGTSALASRGVGDEDFRVVAGIIANAFVSDLDSTVLRELKARVAEFATKFPLCDGMPSVLR